MKDVTRANCKGVVAASLDEVKAKVAEKFGKTDIPNIHLDSDGTEIDDEDYFQTLEPNTELVAVFTGEQWIDVSKIHTHACDDNNKYLNQICCRCFRSSIIDGEYVCELLISNIETFRFRSPW